MDYMKYMEYEIYEIYDVPVWKKRSYKNKKRLQLLIFIDF